MGRSPSRFAARGRRAPAGLGLLLIGLLTIGAGCADREGEAGAGGSQEEDVERMSIEEVLRERTPGLMAVRGVTGTGLGDCGGEPCIVVFVATDSLDLAEALPDTLDGYRVDVRVSGEVRARREPPD
ncbi:MAG: hypothetical protein GTO46_07370 [Gemmatimonadetes bacterium]|nr:hypothetical protein [Gemmatimonadota bacterium]NIO31451.1 hypothetical protein [Gemmatimonadota bacterium]